jgi:hypothetical protein
MQKEDYSYLELSYILPIYIQNPESTALVDMISHYEMYPKELLSRIQFILVDDCSPVKITLPKSTLNIVLVRITDNIEWNQGGARNLGVQLAKTSKLVLTDLDHIFPEILLKKMLASRQPKYLNKFKRQRDGKRVNAHPNSFFCTKSLFYKCLGYDEAFSGHYGHDDIFFVEMQKALGTKIRYFNQIDAVVHVEHFNNTNVEQHFLSRDTTFNEALFNTKMALINKGKNFEAHSRLLVNFKYEIISPVN